MVSSIAIPISTGICIDIPLKSFLVLGIYVNKEPKVSPIPVFIYGATHGVGSETLIFHLSKGL